MIALDAQRRRGVTTRCPCYSDAADGWSPRRSGRFGHLIETCCEWSLFRGVSAELSTGAGSIEERCAGMGDIVEVAWVGIDAGKVSHHATLVDADGTIVWSRQVRNDQAAVEQLSPKQPPPPRRSGGLWI